MCPTVSVHMREREKDCKAVWTFGFRATSTRPIRIWVWVLFYVNASASAFERIRQIVFFSKHTLTHTCTLRLKLYS